METRLIATPSPISIMLIDVGHQRSSIREIVPYRVLNYSLIGCRICGINPHSWYIKEEMKSVI